MLIISSWIWSFWLAFYCWCAVTETEGKRWMLVDSRSSEIDLPSKQEASHCMDQVKNDDESDIDCGGLKCPKCNNTMRCREDCDCVSNTCTNKRCISFASCDDNIKNQDESDIDCGGTKCLKCEASKACKDKHDCISGICKNKICVAAETCDDNIKNRDESDIDCGGIKCPRCEDSKICKENCDCISGSCKDNICAAAVSCKDKIKNQDETDVDCGGNTCPKCGDLNICTDDCDCLTGICEDNQCTPICTPECQNNGTCIGHNNCSCTDGFSGPTCEVQSVGLCYDNDTMGAAPILMVTFGSGAAQYSTATPASFNFSTTYKQRTQPVTNDGMFSFINSIHDDFKQTWHTNATDHTEDDGGYMLLVNADYRPGRFYKGTVSDLCVGLRYEFSVYLANVCTPTDRIQPNVRFEVRSSTDDNQLLAQLRSGAIPVHKNLRWKKYGLSFTAPSSTVVLLMISDAPGGLGNDIVIDDISLRVCSHEGTGFCPSH